MIPFRGTIQKHLRCDLFYITHTLKQRSDASPGREVWIVPRARPVIDVQRPDVGYARLLQDVGRIVAIESLHQHEECLNIDAILANGFY